MIRCVYFFFFYWRWLYNSTSLFRINFSIRFFSSLNNRFNLLFLLCFLSLKHSFEFFRVFSHLPLNTLNLLTSLFIINPYLIEYFPYHSQTIKLLNFLNFSTQVLIFNSFNFHNLLFGVSVIIDSASISKGIMHCQFLLKIPDLFFIPFNSKCGINHGIYCRLILYLHHSSGKF